MSKELKSRIEELEEALKLKDQELSRYRNELVKTNQSLERIIVDLTQELKWVSIIQKALAPTQIPNIPGFEFSSKFLPGQSGGGDYFDIFEHDDRLKFGVLLSSSSGYSMSALFLSVLMKISGRIEAKKGLQPQQALDILAQEMTPNLQAKDEASIFYGVVDRRSFELRYTLLGELAVFHQPHAQDKSQEKLVRMDPAGKALSLKNNTGFIDHTIQLGPRDRVVLCSEGLVQAKNPAGEVFGMERLQKLVLRAPRAGVHELRNEILFRTEQFSETAEPIRDQTVIVIEVNDRVIKLAK